MKRAPPKPIAHSAMPPYKTACWNLDGGLHRFGPVLLQGSGFNDLIIVVKTIITVPCKWQRKEQENIIRVTNMISKVIEKKFNYN